jgi:poly-beta-1,6-N-acetyl-D-glucosamine synthase
MTQSGRHPHDSSRAMRIVCVVPFLDEQRDIQRFLDSIARQTRFPDLLVMVDDGSTDDSPAIAAAFASRRPDVRLLRRPARSRSRDRLASANELRSFQWALAEVREPWELAVKMDADLELATDLFETLERAFLGNPELGIAGAYLSAIDPATGALARERCPPKHVRGATKFYRRACLGEISPIPAILGWDTIDEITARKQGWQTGSIACPCGETVHLRPTGSVDGRLRAHYRWGACAYGIGQHPLWVALSAVRRLGERPRLIGSAAFLTGWVASLLRQLPRAPADVRAFGRQEQLSDIRHRVRRALPA